MRCYPPGLQKFVARAALELMANAESCNNSLVLQKLLTVHKSAR